MAIDGWMPTLKAKLAEITAITQVHSYDDLPADIVVFPTAIILPIGGSVEYSAGGPNMAYHDVQVTVYLASQILPEAFSVGVPLIELVRNKLAANVKLGATVEYILPTSGGRFYEGPGRVNYGDKEMLGIVFRYVVKENETGSYPVSA